MGGKLVKVTARTDSTFSLAASGSQEIIVGDRAVQSTDWSTAFLIILFHSKSLASSTATLTIKAHQTFFDPENPTVLWAQPNGTPLATQVIANADVAPQMYILPLSSVGAYIRCTIAHSQGANVGACTWTTSIYLLGRDS